MSPTPSKLSYDVSLSSQSATGFQLTLNCSQAAVFSGVTIKYFAIASNSSLFDVRLNSQTFPSTSGVGYRTSTTRSSSMIITYRNKSNINNAVVVYFTVGVSMAWSNSTNYAYSLANTSMLQSNYTLVLTVQPGQSISFVRICTINYELLLLPAGDYYDCLLLSTSTSGSIPQNSSTVGVSDFSVVLAGLTAFTFDQTATSVKFQIVVSEAAYQASGYVQPTTSYFWYRRLICPDGYYVNLTSSQCFSCHYSCLTCNNSNLVSQCLSCSSSNYRTLSNGYCVCQTNYQDIGLASCSYAVCSSTCLTCSNMDICASCNASLFRTLVLQSCPCMDRYYDDSPNLPCLPCGYACLTCNSTNCISCSNGTDHRVLDEPSATCKCLDGYYDNGVAVCATCQYSCKSCAAASSCQTCETTNNRYITTAGVGYCLCSLGYYDNGSSQACIACPYYCSDCTSTSVCVSCLSPTTRVLSGGTCPCISSKYYDDLMSAECQPCDYSCQACTNNTACSSCNTSKFRVLNTSLSPFCSCMPYYF